MRGNSSVWSRTARSAAILLFLVLPVPSFCADWYASNAAGIALETVIRGRALRLEHALSIELPDSGSVPPSAREILAQGGRCELRILWTRGKETRREISVWDRTNILRLQERTTANGTISRERRDAESRLVEESELAADGTGTMTRYRYERTILRSSDTVAVELSASGTPEERRLWNDAYRYDRVGALVSVDRIPEKGEEKSSARFVARSGVPRLLETRSPDGYAVRTRFDDRGRVTENASVDVAGAVIGTIETTRYEDARPDASSAPSVPAVSVVLALPEAPAIPLAPALSPSSAVSVPAVSVPAVATVRSVSLGTPEPATPAASATPASSAALQAPAARTVQAAGAVPAASPGYGVNAVRYRVENEASVETYLDGKGRTLSETRKGKNGELLEETVNTWKDDRLVSVEVRTKGVTRLTEYEYDRSGDRIAERNYRGGLLERSRKKEGENEVEELYLNGKVVLRALWVGGVKMKEERVRATSR